MSKLDNNNNDWDIEDRFEFERSDDEPEEEPELADKYAIGMKFDPETGLPVVTSLGRGLIARMMEEKAGRAGVEVERDPEMVKRMFRPTTDEAIPTRTYQIIAEILTFIYQVNEAYTGEEAREEMEKIIPEVEESFQEELEEELIEELENGDYIEEDY
ncbi:MAG: EscU/YscU/HrcU family type III secretion system export apparatus switch protein [Vulcanimicrobiota bacterium]